MSWNGLTNAQIDFAAHEYAKAVANSAAVRAVFPVLSHEHVIRRIDEAVLQVLTDVGCPAEDARTYLNSIIIRARELHEGGRA